MGKGSHRSSEKETSGYLYLLPMLTTLVRGQSWAYYYISSHLGFGFFGTVCFFIVQFVEKLASSEYVTTLHVDIPEIHENK